MTSAVIQADRVSYGTPDGRILQQDLSFTLGSGELLLITGSNGCGKSTLLRAILGQFPVLEGEVTSHVSEGAIQYIPQLENTEVHLPLTLWDVLTISYPAKLKPRDVTRFGLLREEQLFSAWNTASGGERKRTMLTRALLRDPKLLVFDEPMNHLDTDSRRSMIRVMAEFLSNDDDKCAIVMVCHQGLKDDERDRFKVLHLNLDREEAST